MKKADSTATALNESFEVVVPHEAIQNRVDQLLAQKAKTAQLRGFRPGKVPPVVVRDRYLNQMVQEAVEFFIQSESRKVLQINKIKPATQPTYDLKPYEFGKDLSFSLKIEKLPTVELAPYTEMTIDRIDCPVSDADIKDHIATLLKTFKAFDKAGANAKPSAGHRVLLNITSQMGKKQLAERSAQNKMFILSDGDAENAELLTQLSAHKVGETFNYTVHLPKDYAVPALAGKHYTSTIEFLGHSVPADRDATEADLIAESGIKDTEELLAVVKQQLEKVRTENLHLYHKRLTLDYLSNQYTFDLPATLVEGEFNAIWQRLQEELKQVQPDGVDADEEKAMREEYMDIAKRRVRLGLVISEIAAKEKIQISNDMLSRAVVNEAMKYPGQEREVIRYFKENQAALESLTAPLIEDMVIRFILQNMKAAPKTVTADEMNSRFKGVLPGYDDEDDVTSTKAAKAKKPAAEKKTKKAAE